jgi:FkbH-like protein
MRLLGGGEASSAELFEDVDRYADAVAGVGDRAASILVPTWTAPTYQRGLGLADLGPGGLGRALWEMNLRLASNLERVRHCYVLNAQKWIEAVGPSAFNTKYWYMGKVPFGPGVFKQAIADIKGAIQAIRGESRKLIVLDLDDTLWGGIVGEVGWEKIRLGGHDPIGEAFQDFQRALKGLEQRGVLLAIASKNEEGPALAAIDHHPGMVLRRQDFIAWRVNWADKALNVAELAEEVNLGLQSVVFIDDNPVERARVREALPEVLVPEWPDDKMLYRRALLELRCFDTPTVTSEDRRRTGMYLTERARRQAVAASGSLQQWLQSLNVVIGIEELNDANLKRAAQLINKTNQMNLSTRRLTEAQLMDWARRDRRKVWCISVEDRFGDSGLTGIVSVENGPDTTRVVDFVLSCRVFGRQIESAMMHLAVEDARAGGCRWLEAFFQPTEKNKPCLDFLNSSGLRRDADGATFRWDLGQPYPLPEFITLRQVAQTAG